MGFRYEDIVKRICDEKGVLENDVHERVKLKLDKLSGLISKEGAAHIVANEFGVDLISSMKKYGIKIAQVGPGMRNVTIVGKIVKDYGMRVYQKEGREGRVASFLVGDESGILRVVVWDTTLIEQIQAHHSREGCVVRVSDGFVKENNGYKEMHLGGRSMITLNPEGVHVGDVAQSSGPSFSRMNISDAGEGNFVQLRGTVVQVFEPRFYEGCPECGRKLDGGCKEHGSVEGITIPILHFSFDDGTGNLPVVLFRDDVRKALGVGHDVLLSFSTDPQAFERVKQEFLGKQMVVSGKVQKNMMFDRLEVIAHDVSEVQPGDLLDELSRHS